MHCKMIVDPCYQAHAPVTSYNLHRSASNCKQSAMSLKELLRGIHTVWLLPAWCCYVTKQSHTQFERLLCRQEEEKASRLQQETCLVSAAVAPSDHSTTQAQGAAITMTDSQTSSPVSVSLCHSMPRPPQHLKKRCSALMSPRLPNYQPIVPPPE